MPDGPGTAGRPPRRIHGVVLAGGRSRRMGRDKAGTPLRGRSLLAWTCDALAPQCAGLLVSLPAGATDEPRLGHAVVADRLAGFAGPLAGVLAGLDEVARRDPSATHVVTVAVDTPFLPADLVARLWQARDGIGVVCAASGGRRHPVAALWPVAVAAALRERVVAEGMSRVGEIMDRFGAVAVDWPTERYDPFLNVNTPADLAAAERLAASLAADQ